MISWLGQADSQTGPEAMRVMVGPWHEIGGTPEGRRLNRGPAGSGVFARFEPAEPPVPAGGSRGGGAASDPAVQRLTGLDRQAEPVRDYGPGAGLVAAMRQGNRPPVRLVTGGSAAAVGRAADLLDRASLEGRYAAAAVGNEVVSLPLP